MEYRGAFLHRALTKKVYTESEFLSIYDYSLGTFLLYLFKLTSCKWRARLIKFGTHIDNPNKWSKKQIWTSWLIIYARYLTLKKTNFNFSNAQSPITRVNDDRWRSEFFCDHLWGLSICVPNFISLALHLQEVNL